MITIPALAVALLLWCLPSGCIYAPPTSGNLETKFHVTSLTGSSSVVGSINFRNNIGQFSMNGHTYTGVLYVYQAWASQNLDLFDVLAVRQDGGDLAVLYLYSDLNKAQITTVYYESLLLGYMSYATASGTVQWSTSSFNTNVTFPALNVPIKPLDTGITILGQQLTLNSNSGWLVKNGQNYSVMSFATVDCTNCGNGGWLELHSMFSLGNDVACFGILYLMLNDHSYVQLQYGLCLPNLEQMSGVYDSSWSGKISTERNHFMTMHGISHTLV